MNKKKRYVGAIALIKSQTNYTDEEAIEKKEKWDGNYMNVIKEYLNPNFNVKVIKKDTRSTKEKMMTEIRDFMDTASRGFVKRKEEEEKRQEYLKNVHAKFLEVKKGYPECNYAPPTVLTCTTNCQNPLCPGELLPNKKYSKIENAEKLEHGHTNIQ